MAKSPAKSRGRRGRAAQAAAAAAVALLGVAAAAPALAQEALQEALPEAPRADGLGAQAAREAARSGAADGAAETAGEADPFARLRSEDEAVWRAALEEITGAWRKSGSPSMDLLLQRGRKALEAEKYDVAIEHLTDLVNLAPRFAEGWNMRATAFYKSGAHGPALADLAEAIALEPRHFHALAGLGVLFREIGRDREALAAFRAALELNPHLEGPDEVVKELAKTVEGRGA